MIGLIVLGAFIVGTVLANLRLPQFISQEIGRGSFRRSC